MNTKLKGCLLSLILLVTVTAVHAQTRLAEANTSADMDSAIILDSVPVKRNFLENFWITLTMPIKKRKIRNSILVLSADRTTPAIPN